MICNNPHLGLATTEELLREVIARQRQFGPHDVAGQYRGIDRIVVLSEMIGGMSAPEREYRTVDS